MNAAPGKGRIRSLDGLRGVAIVMVVGFHAGWPGFSGGGRGVDLFFVLSGFLVTSLLLEERRSSGGVSLRGFFARRALRILPALVVFLAGYAVLCAAVFTDFLPRLPESLAAAGFFFTNVAVGWFGRPILLDHTWALALEGQFYALYPPFLVRMNTVRLIATLAAAVFGVLVWRVLLYFHISGGDYPSHRFVYGPDTRVDTILAGCLLAALAHEPRTRSTLLRFARTAVLPLAGLALIGVATLLAAGSRAWSETLGYSLTAAGACLLVAAAALAPSGVWARVLARPLIARLGDLSFPIFLWHPAVLGVANRAAHHAPPGLDGVVRQVVFVSGTLLAAALSHRFIERPFTATARRSSAAGSPVREPA